MRGAVSSIRHAGVLLLLVLLAVTSLRGYLPGVGESPVRAGQAPSSSAVLLVVVSWFLMAAAVVLFGMLGGPRQKRPRLPEESSRVAWRVWQLVRGVALVAAILVVSVIVLGVALVLGESTGPGDKDEQSTAGIAHQGPSVHPTLPWRPWQANATGDAVVDLVIVAMLLVGILTLGVAVFARGSASPIGEPEVSSNPRPVVSGSLVRAAELGLAEVTEPGRDPRAAIVACYAAMERGLAEAPDAAPLASDTPSEVLARAVDQGALHSDAAAHLVGLFTEARFSPHRMTEKHRESAVEWLRIVLNDFRSRR
jgi:hypothetical protein